MLNSSWHLLSTVLKVESRMVVGMQNRCQCIVVSPRDRVAGGSCSCHCPASRERIVPRVISPGKDENSQLEVWFLLNVYYFHSVIKLNHR